jgi:hypothetical protein
MSRPTTWREAIQTLNKLKLGAVDFQALALCAPTVSASWLRDYREFDRRFNKRWIHSWICTDTEVGIAVIVLDGEPVAISEQSARKEDETIRFLSLDARTKTIAALEELTDQPESDKPILVDLDEKIDEQWFSR